MKFKIKAAIKPYKESVFLRAGYSANGDVIIDRRAEVVTVYERDVIYKDDKTYVNKVVGDKQTERVEVKLGLSDGLIVEVEEGLDTSTSIQIILDLSAQ